MEHPNGRYQRESVQRAIDWIFSMQCRNGGWASFDKNNTRMVFQYVPFADHNAMLDPPTVISPGRMLEMLAAYGYTTRASCSEQGLELHPERARARWLLVRPLGVNYIYGTMLVLARAGSDGRRPSRALCPAGGRMAAYGAEPGWRLGRNLRLL